MGDRLLFLARFRGAFCLLEQGGGVSPLLKAVQQVNAESEQQDRSEERCQQLDVNSSVHG